MQLSGSYPICVFNGSSQLLEFVGSMGIHLTETHGVKHLHKGLILLPEDFGQSDHSLRSDTSTP